MKRQNEGLSYQSALNAVRDKGNTNLTSHRDINFAASFTDRTVYVHQKGSVLPGEKDPCSSCVASPGRNGGCSGLESGRAKFNLVEFVEKQNFDPYEGEPQSPSEIERVRKQVEEDSAKLLTQLACLYTQQSR